MAPITFINGIMVDLDPPRAVLGTLRVEGGSIVGAGDRVRPEPGDEVFDCAGAVVLPGLVNGHTHLYSALACGMPPPADPPANFREILERIWWKLDLALNERAVRASAVVGALDALHCGTTTLIDHHASPGCIGGSLDVLEGALDRVGLRGVLCYEVTDRNGPQGRDAGLAENERYLDKCMRRDEGRFAGLVGAHALFTLADETLGALSRQTREFDVGLHIHLAEDPCDEEACSSEHQMFLLDRLRSHKLLQPETLLAHGTHLSDDDVRALAGLGCSVVHNPRSNMNNAVGYARIARMCPLMPVLLGTDGIGSNMLAEARAAYFKSCDEGPALPPDVVLGMMAQSARRASGSLGVDLGQLEPGCAADLVVTDYVPATPIHDANVAGHLLFGLEARHVKDVMVGGQWQLRDRRAIGLDEAAERRAAAQVAADLWQRI